MRNVVRLAVAGSLLATTAIARDVTLQGSADFENMHRGGTTTRGKLFALGRKLRTETDLRGQPISVIMDTDASRMWLLIGPSCLEQSLAGDPHRTSFLIPEKGAKEELVGKETIDGHPTEKYKVTSVVAGGSRVNYVWRAKDLKGFPIQTSDASGDSVTRLRNVVAKKPDAKLFKPPADCKPVTKIGEIQKQLEQYRKGQH